MMLDHAYELLIIVEKFQGVMKRAAREKEEMKRDDYDVHSALPARPEKNEARRSKENAVSAFNLTVSKRENCIHLVHEP